MQALGFGFMGKQGLTPPFFLMRQVPQLLDLPAIPTIVHTGSKHAFYKVDFFLGGVSMSGIFFLLGPGILRATDRFK